MLSARRTGRSRRCVLPLLYRVGICKRIATIEIAPITRERELIARGNYKIFRFKGRAQRL